MIEPESVLDQDESVHHGRAGAVGSSDPTDPEPPHRVAPEETFRAGLYDLLAALMRGEPDPAILASVANMKGNTTPLGQALQSLCHLARVLTCDEIRQEYLRLFIGLGRGELIPYASFYLTGFLNEKPLATLRDDMRGLGIERSEGFYESEDHIAALCDIMVGMILGRFNEAAPLQLQRAFFDRHVKPWAEHFFTDLEGAKSSRFYAPLGALGRLFIQIETAAFEMDIMPNDASDDEPSAMTR